jgi:hypothetical protein
MRDHLYRLAAHALDRLPAAAPRIGSRFEPVSETEPLAPKVALGTAEPVVTGPGHRRSPGAPAVTGPLPTAAMEDQSIEMAPAETAHPSDPPPTRGPAGAHTPGPAPRLSAAAPAGLDDAGAPRPATAPVAANSAAATAGPELLGPAQTRLSGEEETAPPEVTPSRHRMIVAASPAASSDDAPATAESVPTLAAAARRVPTAEAPPAGAAPAGVNHVADALLPPEAPEPRNPAGGLPLPLPAAPEPAIHVSIGRVEVRVTPPAAPPPPAAKSPAVMGLDDYLRRRRGGGRS